MSDSFQSGFQAVASWQLMTQPVTVEGQNKLKLHRTIIRFTPRNNQVLYLPTIAKPDQLERVNAAMTKFSFVIERIWCPDNGKIPVDIDAVYWNAFIGISFTSFTHERDKFVYPFISDVHPPLFIVIDGLQNGAICETCFEQSWICIFHCCEQIINCGSYRIHCRLRIGRIN